MNRKHLLMILGASMTLGIGACDKASSERTEGAAQPGATSPDVALQELTLAVSGMT